MTSSRKQPYQQQRLTVRRVKENIGSTPVENKVDDFEPKRQTRIKEISKHRPDYLYLNKDLAQPCPILRPKKSMAKSRASGQSSQVQSRLCGQQSRTQNRASGQLPRSQLSKE